MNTDEPKEADPQTAPESAPAPTGDSVEELIRRHRELDEELRALAEMGNLTPSQQLDIAMMKKRKLALKDQITALSGSS